MWLLCEFHMVLYCVLLTLTHGREQEGLVSDIGNQTKTYCNETVLSELDECWTKLPPLTFQGIPSTPKNVDEACRTFLSGMDCMVAWSETCLSKKGQEKMESSIFGAYQTYQFLCTDEEFRAEFFKHINCYQIITPQWNSCNHRFRNTLKIIDHEKDELSLCCVRMSYIKCVTESASNLCTKRAKKFLSTITESLMDATLMDYRSSRCDTVSHKNCSADKSSAKSSGNSTCMSVLSFLTGFWAYFVIG